MYVVELNSGIIVGKYSKKEAYDVARSYRDKFNVQVHVYPEEPNQFAGMCECCGYNPAEEDSFLCSDCHTSLYDRF